MKTPGKVLEDHLAVVAESFPKDDITRIIGIKCEADIISSSVFLDYHSKYDDKYPNRPYLHIMGECRAIRGDLPYGVNEITFEKGRGIDTDFFYEFTDAELSDIAAKGLFHAGFKCPDIFFDNKFELPVMCDFRVVNPQSENDVPIIFASIANQKNISIDEASCGYTFGDYFEQYEPEDEKQADDVIFDNNVENKDLYEQEEYIEDEYESEDTHDAEQEEEDNDEKAILSDTYDAIKTRVETHIKKDKEEKKQAEIHDSDFLDDNSFEIADDGRNEQKQVSPDIDMISDDFEDESDYMPSEN